LAIAMKQYVQDYDEQYPPARQWSDGLAPYLKNEQVFHCPATKGHDGYAMNWKISRRNESKLMFSVNTVLLFESTDLRRNVYNEGSGIAYRHSNGTNIAFLDCHVKWYPKNATEKWPDVQFSLNPNEHGVQRQDKVFTQ
jgi:prepilin-type processing-associated H-X9-DG protein